MTPEKPVRSSRGRLIKSTEKEWAQSVTRLLRGISTLTDEARLLGVDVSTISKRFQRSTGHSFADMPRCLNWSRWLDSAGVRGVTHYSDPIVVMHDRGSFGSILEVWWVTAPSSEAEAARIINLGRLMWLLHHEHQGALPPIGDQHQANPDIFTNSSQMG